MCTCGKNYNDATEFRCRDCGKEFDKDEAVLEILHLVTKMGDLAMRGSDSDKEQVLAHLDEIKIQAQLTNMSNIVKACERQYDRITN